MRVKLKDINPNPFRDMERYIPNPIKIAQLKQSIQDTEFWDNLICRQVGGQVEIAYGHHRLLALRELYDGEHEVNLIPKKLDDAMMLKIMANENMEEWGALSDTNRETVRSVVKAFADGRIVLPKPNSKTSSNQLRSAPSFKQGCAFGPNAHPYTTETIATFLGWEPTQVKYTLQALELIEQKALREEQLQGLTANQSRTVVDEVVKSLRAAEQVKAKAEKESIGQPEARKQVIVKKAEDDAKAVIASTARNVSTALKSGSSAAEAKQKAQDVRLSVKPHREVDDDISKVAESLARKVASFLDLTPDTAMGCKLKQIFAHKSHLSTKAITELDVALETLAKDAEAFRAELNK